VCGDVTEAPTNLIELFSVVFKIVLFESSLLSFLKLFCVLRGYTLAQLQRSRITNQSNPTLVPLFDLDAHTRTQTAVHPVCALTQIVIFDEYAFILCSSSKSNFITQFINPI
jgi:hypothetical protein